MACRWENVLSGNGVKLSKMIPLAYTMIFLMGLTGSMHCAGMCGPIIWVMPFQALSGYKKWLGIALYHLGRLSVYATLGLILFSFKSVFDPHVQQYVSMIAGALLLIAGIASFIPGKTLQFNLPWAGWVRAALAKFMAKPGLLSLLFTGALNGLLPCGLVYVALSASITAQSAVGAMLMMYTFGLGTVPMLVMLTVLKNRVSFVRQLSIRKLVPVTMLLFGCLFILRGMNLGVPYLSPKLEMEKNEIKASCCHKTVVKK